MSPDHGGNRERQCDPETVAEHRDTVSGMLVVTSMRAVSGMCPASTRGSVIRVSVPYAVQPVVVVLDVLVTVRFMAVVFVIVVRVAVVLVAVLLALVRVLLAPAMIH